MPFGTAIANAMHQFGSERHINTLGALRFLRPARVERTPKTDTVADGLDAFATEPTKFATTDASTPGPGRRSLYAIGVLMAVVVIEAVPTALWLGARFQSSASASSASTLPVVPPPTTIAALPCEAAPAPVPAPAVAETSAAATAPVAAAGTRPAAMLAGLVAVAAPLPMHIYERGRLIGTTEAESMMLSVGTHALEFVNESVGYRVRQVVTVQAGQTSAVRLEAPRGTLHVNAVPWAEVWLDNEPIGQTPIGNVQARIGTRQLVFRHPELGERRATVLVTLIGPARISMDLRNK